MLADELPIFRAARRETPLSERIVGALVRFWAGYWWLLRAHVAATHLIPRSCLEDPPEDWMAIMLGPVEQDRREARRRSL